MKTKILLEILLVFICLPSYSNYQDKHRENGWYHVINRQKDSLSINPIVTVKDFIGLKLDTDIFGKYVINGQISKHKLNKWAVETGKAIGKQIAFTFKDSVISSPTVNARLESGAFQITSHSNKELLDIYKQLMKEKSDSLDALFKEWEKDSLYYELPPKQRDSAQMNIDYWEAKAWIDLTTKPKEHYWYSIQDSTEYKRLEKALREELEKPNVSNKASDYMKSDAYKAYKQYLHDNEEYISLMFQGFMFKELKGLCGYLVDDIIQSKYPSVPSIRSYVNEAGNMDDERFAVYEWERKVWYQMNIAQEKPLQVDDRKAQRCFSIIGRTFIEEYIVPNQVTKSPLSAGTCIQIEEIPKRSWVADKEGYFKIDSLQKGKYHLTFSCVGLEHVDTVIFVNDNIDLKIILSDFSIHTPRLSLILSKKEENNILKDNFWDKYGLTVSWYTKESLQDKSQRLTILSYSHIVKRNQIVFDYLDKKYGYSWRFEAPKGIIGLDEKLDTYGIFTK